MHVCAILLSLYSGVPWYFFYTGKHRCISFIVEVTYKEDHRLHCTSYTVSVISNRIMIPSRIIIGLWSV